MSWHSFKDRFKASLHSLHLEKLSSDLERMWSIFDLELTNLRDVTLLDNGPFKSKAAFSAWKDKGNALLGSGAIRDACTAYTQALFFAPELADLAVAFGNRSAALLQLGLASESLSDITRCLNAGYPEGRRFRLLTRSGECRQMLGDVAAAREDFAAALRLLQEGPCDVSPKQTEAWCQRVRAKLRPRGCSSDDSDPTTALRHFSCEWPSAPAPSGGASAKLPSASAAIEVRTSQQDGRGLYAVRALKIGEVLVSEHPFSSCLIGERWLSHCGRCFRRSPALLPCRACPNLGFCSTRCESEAWEKFHRFECPVMGQIGQLPNLKMVRLAYRTLVQTDVTEVQRVVGEAAATWAGGEADLDFASLFPDQFDSSDYLAAFSIVGNSARRSSCDLTERALMALYLLLCAAKAGYLTAPLERSEAAIVGAALLRHLQSLPCNAHEISEEVVPANGDLSSAGLEEVASGLFPVLSLVNHSCDPNVHRVCYKDGVCLLRSLRTIAAGEQLVDCYSQHFAVGPRAERKAALAEQYFFQCACPPCEHDWPQYEALCEITYPALMKRELSPADAKAWEKFTKRLESIMALLANGREAFCREDEAEKFFVRFQTFLCGIVKRPWKELNTNEECLKILWNLKGNFYQDFS